MLLVLASLGGVLPSPARAQGFPDLDPEREAFLVKAGPGAASPRARTRGTWRVDEGGLGLVEPARWGWSYWLPEAPAARMADGFVRARFVVGERLDSTLLFRASVAEDDDDALSGYGLSLEKDLVRLYRWDRGIVRSLGAELAVPGLLERGSLEVTLFFVGPHVSATVYDGDTLQPLGAVAARDATYGGGRVGLRAHARQDAKSRVALLSVQRAGAPARDDDDASPDPVGRERLVWIAADDEARLPADLLARVVERRPFSDGRSAAVLVTDPVGAERVRRAGIAPLSVSDALPRVFTDPDYRKHQGRPPIATKTGFDIDESYKDADMVMDLVRAYAARFPRIARLEEIGRSHQGRPILALKISDHPGDDEDEPALLLNAAHHGSELLSTEIALDAIQTLLEGYGRDRKVRRLVDHLEIWCVPLVNPDGNTAYMQYGGDAGRKNGRDLDGDGVLEPDEGVDLNRNYPFRWGALGEVGSRSAARHSRYRGEAPASEPETRALMRLAARERFAASISFHTSGTLILSPYTIDGAENPEPDVAWSVAEEIAKALPRQPGGRRYRVQRNMYAVDGTDQDWHYFAHGTLALLVEAPYHNPTSRFLRTRSVERTRPSWMLLAERLLSGPRLYGRVTDVEGSPVEAEVRVVEVTLKNGEVWTSRPRDGRFDRVVLGDRSYTLRVEKEGYAPFERSVRVTKHPVRIDVTLAKEGEAIRVEAQ